MCCSSSVAEASSAPAEGGPPDRASQKNSQGGKLQAILLVERIKIQLWRVVVVVVVGGRGREEGRRGGGRRGGGGGHYLKLSWHSFLW